MEETVRPVGADVLTAQVDGLTPFTEYSVSVVGTTEGGGDGERSNIVTVTTFEDGKIITQFMYTHAHHSTICDNYTQAQRLQSIAGLSPA